MATKADFTQEEWQQLQHGAMGAALLVSLSDPGLFDTFKEAGAAGRHFAQARREGSSELVRELAASPPVGFGLGKRPPDLEAETLSALRSAASTLESKAPDEAAAYREFVLDVARSVAEAAGGVAGAETAVIDKLRLALGDQA
jgi:hypothetical protein